MDPAELIKEGQLLFVNEKHKESVEAFTKAIEAGADPYIAYLSRGASYLKLEDVDRAIHDFNRAIDANNQSARAHYFRGIVYMMKEDFEKAVLDFTKALELKKDYYIAKFSRSISYARMNMTEEASQDLRAVMPKMEENLQRFADTYGIIRTQMFKVMTQLSIESPLSELKLTEKEIDILKKWLEE